MVSHESKVYSWQASGSCQVDNYTISRSKHDNLPVALKDNLRGKLWKKNNSFVDSHESTQANLNILQFDQKENSIDQHQDAVKRKGLLQVLEASACIEVVFPTLVKVQKLVCSQTIWLFLSEVGTVYSWGSDPQKIGLLGLGNVYEQPKPMQILSIEESKIKSISICESHAWATDLKGKLYTWGSGAYGELGHPEYGNINTPTLVNIDKTVEVKEAQVHQGYTAFKTAGGYLYVMGDIRAENTNSEGSLIDDDKLNQIQGISNYFIRTFWCSYKFIVILTQTGELIYIDEYLKKTKIFSDSWKSKRCKDDQLQYLTVWGSDIISMSRTKLYIWKAKKVKPPIHPASVYESKISDHHNHSSLEILNGTLSSERKNIKKQLYSTMDLKSSVSLYLNPNIGQYNTKSLLNSETKEYHSTS